jgi:hypothetical protein
MSSFWINNPVKIRNDFGENKILLDNNSLLKKINTDIEKSTFKLDYTVSSSENLDKNDKLKILEFINKNYSKKNTSFRLSYSYDLFDFFFKDSIVIKFYPNGKNKTDENIIGIIIGKRKTIFINEKIDKFIGHKEYHCIEVNFLCLIEPLRNLHISSMMINILTKKCIEYFDINIAYYTIGTSIKSPSFCTKYMYHIPINIELLYELEFISTLDKNKYNFKEIKDLELIYINGTSSKEFSKELIFNSIVEYSIKNYDIFDNIKLDDIKNIFSNKAFHNFLFVDKSNLSVKNYFCFFDLNSIEKDTGKTLKNGFLFIMFLDKLDKLHKSSEYLQMIIDYCNINQIFDILTLTNMSSFSNIEYIEGAGILKYYMFNMELNKYKDERNGLVTI